jgi:tRNA nucleotidyltransferase (CCA-adding enzyme)
LVSPQEEVVTTSVTEEVETPGVSDVSVSEEVVEEPIQGVTEGTPELPKYLQHAFESKTEDKSFNEAIATVVIDDIDKDQEALVPELLEKFNKYGFSFQESSWLGDAITVYDYNGTPLEVDLQTFTSSGKQEEYNKLIQFLDNNRRDPKKIQEDLDVEAEDFKHLADKEDKDTESSLLFPQVKTSKAGQITTGPLSVISSLFSSQEKEDAFVVSQRANKYITAGGEKYKQKDFDRLFEEKVKALEIGDDGKPSAAAVNQATYDAKIQQRVNAQEDFINTLSPERKALAEALTAVREAQRVGVSIEEVNSLKQKFNDLYNIDAKKLYNFDGTYIEEGNAPDEVVALNNQIEDGAIEKYESYTPEELENLQVDLLYKTIFSAKKINTHKKRIYNDLGLMTAITTLMGSDYESLTKGKKFAESPDEYLPESIKKAAETGRITETLPLLPGNSPLVQEYNNNVLQLQQVQGALALNYNPSTLEEEGYFSPLKALAVSAYETATGQNIRVADDMVKAYVSGREDAGLKVTDKDKQRAEDSILDEGMSAVGAIIPLIAEIAITKKALNLTGALKNMQVLTRGAQIKSKSPYTRVAIGLVSAAAQEALVFKSTGVLSEQLVSGSGEGLTGAMGGAFGFAGQGGGLILKGLLGSRSTLLQSLLSPIQKSLTLRSVFNGTANATVGTGALYGAEFFDTMVNTDKGFLESVNEVLDVGGTWEMKDGKPTYTGGSPIKKLLVSFSTMGALGLGNAKGWKNMYDAMRSDIKNYKAMEPSEYSKAVETLGLDSQKEYTGEEIKTAYKNKSKESHPDRGGSNEAFIEVKNAYEKLTDNDGMLLAQEQIKKEEGYKKKKRELFFMANRMKNNIEFTGKEYELDYKDAEVIKDLSIGELEALTEDLKKQGISGQDAFTLQGKVQTARNHLKTINDVGITEPGARKRVYDLLNKFTEADRKLEELKNKSKTSKANEALFSEKIKQQEAEVKGITDNLQKEITKTEKDAVQEQTTEEGVLRLEGKEPTEQVGLQEVGQPQQEVTTEVKEEVVEETPTTEVTEEVDIKTETVDTQGRPAKAGARLFNDPNPETAEISAKYKQDKGIETSAGENITELDIDNAMEIADIYEAMEDNPSDPEVQEAYNALAKETVDQYSAMTEAGYEIEIYEGKGEPYANSQEMIDDLKNNKHMYIFSTEGGFGEAGITEQQRKENAMLQDSGFKDKNGKPLLINDLFRGVHDFFGHSERGNSFGAKGEENAWDVHARMFTDKARRAMTAETRGQNSWVNFGPQMRNEKGEIIKKGEPGYLGPKERAFAPQKMVLLPESYSEITETPTTEVTEEVSLAKRKFVEKKQLNETLRNINLKEIKDGKIKKKLPINISKSGIDIINELKTKGYTSLVVGGAVRDSLMGKDPKDIDIEVYGISFDELNKILSKYGKTKLAGKEFGVIKFTDKDGIEYDFSVPRTENRIGVGHKDFKVTVDPNMTPEKAALRRDFTWNALAYDPITQTIHDYFSGIRDLKKGIIRHTSEQFSEDPLRILRAMQFQSRLGLKFHPSTIKLMREMVKEGQLSSLSKERVTEEWMKWATKGSKPALIFNFLRDTGLMSDFGDLKKLSVTEQDIEWHPEGNVETHTGHVMDAAIEVAERENITGDDRAVLMFASLFHDIAKPATTVKETEGKKKGRITSRGHEEMGEPMATKILETLGVKKNIIDRVGVLIANHLAHVSIANEKINPEKATRTLAKKLAKKGSNIQELLWLLEADASGRPPLPKGLPASGKLLKKLAKDVGVVKKPQEDISKGS